MSDFKVYRAAVSSSAEDIRNQGRQIRQLVNAVRSCDRALAEGVADANVHAALNKIMDQMLEAAAHEDSMSAALMHVTKLYETAEKQILSEAHIDKAAFNDAVNAGAQAATAAATAAVLASLPGWLRRLIEWITGGGSGSGSGGGSGTTTPTPPTTPTTPTPPQQPATPAERERAADLEMKQRAMDLRKQKRFSEETWEKASLEERKQILQEYMREVEKILGVKVAENIDWTNTPPVEGVGINMGAYSPSTNTVHINQYVLENRSSAFSYKLVSTIAHELRHAYQHAAVSHPEQYTNVTPETIASWKESFRTYKAEQDAGRYYDIVVEKDARWFAGQD